MHKLLKNYASKIYVFSCTTECVFTSFPHFQCVLVMWCISGRSDRFTVWNSRVSDSRGHSQLARPLKPSPGAVPAAGNPPRTLYLWTPSMDRQLRPPCRLCLRVSVVICNMAVRALPAPAQHYHQQISVYISVCLSACPAGCAVLCQPTVQVSKLSLFQLHSVCAGVLSQHGGRHYTITYLLTVLFLPICAYTMSQKNYYYYYSICKATLISCEIREMAVA